MKCLTLKTRYPGFMVAPLFPMNEIVSYRNDLKIRRGLYKTRREYRGIALGNLTRIFYLIHIQIQDETDKLR